MTNLANGSFCNYRKCCQTWYATSCPLIAKTIVIITDIKKRSEGVSAQGGLVGRLGRTTRKPGADSEKEINKKFMMLSIFKASQKYQR